MNRKHGRARNTYLSRVAYLLAAMVGAYGFVRTVLRPRTPPAAYKSQRTGATTTALDRSADQEATGLRSTKAQMPDSPCGPT